jgi:hypothetical protein
MKLFCSYYCLAIALVAIPFFSILFALEYTESEYMILHFRKGHHDTESRTVTIFIVIAAYLAIVLGLASYIKKL